MLYICIMEISRGVFFSLCFYLKRILEYNGYELKEIVKDRYLKFENFENEIVYIPLFRVGFMNVYFTKNDNLIDVYRYPLEENTKKEKIARSFYRYLKKRHIQKALKSDDETKTYI